jgi:ABC-type polysaccharide/polyol phosphate export permease
MGAMSDTHLTAVEPPWTELRATRGWLRGVDVRELWAYREVGAALVARDFRSRYKQAVLGVLWAVLQPIVAVVLFTAVFGHMAGLPSEGIPYAAFVFSGLLAWNYFNTAVTAASKAIVNEPNLVTKVYFPRMLAPVAAMVPPLVDLGIAFLAMIVVMAVTGTWPDWQVVTLPLWLGLLFTFTLGVGLLYSALHVRYRDVGQAIGLAMQLWFFATPIVFAATAVHGVLRIILACNPLTVVVDGLRWALVDGYPPVPLDLVSGACGVASVAVGIVCFQHMARRFADVI